MHINVSCQIQYVVFYIHTSFNIFLYMLLFTEIHKVDAKTTSLLASVKAMFVTHVVPMLY